MDTLASLKESKDPRANRGRDYLKAELINDMGMYNRDVKPNSASDFGATSLSGSFEATDPYIALNQDPHSGIDIAGGTGFEIPWYTEFEGADTNQGSHPFVLSVPGTSYRIRVKHSDKGAVDNLVSKGLQTFSPGQKVVPYPQNQNPVGIAIHFHVEIRTTQSNVSSPLVNPIGLRSGTHSSYLFNYPAPIGWAPMNTSF